MAPSVQGPTRWRRLLLAVAAVNMVVTLLVQLLLAGAVIPPLVVFFVLYAVAMALGRRPGKSGPVMVGVVSVLFLLGNLPFVAQDLSHPASFLAFSITIAAVAAAIVGVVAMVGFLRGWPSTTAGWVGAAAGAIVVLGVALSVAASLFVSNEGAEPGDLAFKASDTKFKPGTVQARVGRVAVHVGNEDLSRHTFTIETLGVDLEIPASKSRRVEFDARPGTYTYTCEVDGHEDMKGTLTVQ